MLVRISIFIRPGSFWTLHPDPTCPTSLRSKRLSIVRRTCLQATPQTQAPRPSPRKGRPMTRSSSSRRIQSRSRGRLGSSPIIWLRVQWHRLRARLSKHLSPGSKLPLYPGLHQSNGAAACAALSRARSLFRHSRTAGHRSRCWSTLPFRSHFLLCRPSLTGSRRPSRPSNCPKPSLRRPKPA